MGEAAHGLARRDPASPAGAVVGEQGSAVAKPVRVVAYSLPKGCRAPVLAFRALFLFLIVLSRVFALRCACPFVFLSLRRFGLIGFAAAQGIVAVV